jgi:hypothetical protein
MHFFIYIRAEYGVFAVFSLHDRDEAGGKSELG